tara:strand:+ start:48 stop:1004 length:957 start_codon:yes stop_codon:yes gene_type:complete
MSLVKTLAKQGFKALGKATTTFLEEAVPRSDVPGIIKLATDNPNKFRTYLGHIDNYAKNGEQGGLMEAMSISDEANSLLRAERQQRRVREIQTTKNSDLVKNYTRPDAVENLRQLGGQTKFGKTARTIQGPVPPRLDDKTFAQGAKTQEEAIMAGTTKFVKNGDPFQIRNYGAGYAPKGQTTKVGTRKTTGRGITAEGNTRKINELLATADDLSDAEKKEFGKIMAQAAAEGMDGDHIIEVSRVANAVRNMTPERRAAYFKVFRNANVALGNDPKNIQKLTKELNQIVKPAEIRSLDNALRGMDTRGKSLLQEMLGIE